jgi:excisionase family DNA binding protein
MVGTIRRGRRDATLRHDDTDRRRVMMNDERGSSGVVRTRRPAALTERQVAEQLGLSVATLRAWRHRGKGPRFLRLGRSVRYLPSDVDEFVRASAVDTQSDSSSDEDSELGELHV